MKKVYKFGDCIPESTKIYKKLKIKGYNPIMVEGWVKVHKSKLTLKPDEKFLKLFYPDEYNKLQNNHYNNYTRVLQHTWVEIKNHKIDITKNQFNEFEKIEKYYIFEKYYL